MRRAAKVDSNQAAIVAALRDVGASVYPTHAVGDGFPDLVVAFRGRTFLVEVKNPDTARGRAGLSDSQQDFADGWQGGDVYMVNEIDDALRVIGAME